MIKRFFKKSANIDEISDYDLEMFERKEKLKAEKSRVQDFYNYLSSYLLKSPVQEEENTDYEYFGAKSNDEIDVIEKLRKSEKSFLKKINPEVLSSKSRLLKSSFILSRIFEDTISSGSVDSGEINKRLRNILDIDEIFDGKNEESIPLGELCSKDLSFLKYLALLSKKKAFFKIEGKLERDNSGNIIKYTPMEEFSEIFSSDIFNIAMPNYKLKLAEKDIYSRKRFNKVERGQNMIILLDDSGSMNHHEKISMVQAALVLKLRDVSDAHNLYIGTFERSVYGFKKIEKGKTYEELARGFIYFNKGNTNVNDCIKDTISQIKARKLKGFNSESLMLNDNHFEILVINDGQDAVDPTFHPQIKLHAL